MTGTQNPPSKTAGDVLHASARGILQAIPFAGGLAAELLTLVIAPPLEKRRDEWMNGIAQQLQELQAKYKITVDDLRNNETFIDVVLEATRIALKTSQRDKRNALINAVLNSAAPSSIDDALQQMFLRFLDELTVAHIRLLTLFSDRPAAMAPIPPFGAIYDVIEEKLPELKGRRGFYEQLWRDLSTRSLVTTPNLADVDVDRAFLPRKASELGMQFLRFISAPE